jgi:hypothetical protein
MPVRSRKQRIGLHSAFDVSSLLFCISTGIFFTAVVDQFHRYIPSFNKDFLTAVATTASWNEVSALRTVLYRHIAREPTIEVIIPVCDVVQAKH